VCLARAATALGVDRVDQERVGRVGVVLDIVPGCIDDGDDLRVDATVERPEFGGRQPTVDLHHVGPDRLDAPDGFLDGVWHRHQDARHERWDAGGQFDGGLVVDLAGRLDRDAVDDTDGVRARGDGRVAVLGTGDPTDLDPRHASPRRSSNFRAASPDSMASRARSTPSSWLSASPAT